MTLKSKIYKKIYKTLGIVIAVILFFSFISARTYLRLSEINEINEMNFLQIFVNKNEWTYFIVPLFAYGLRYIFEFYKRDMVIIRYSDKKTLFKKCFICYLDFVIAIVFFYQFIIGINMLILQKNINIRYLLTTSVQQFFSLLIIAAIVSILEELLENYVIVYVLVLGIIIVIENIGSYYLHNVFTLMDICSGENVIAEKRFFSISFILFGLIASNVFLWFYLIILMMKKDYIKGANMNDKN